MDHYPNTTRNPSFILQINHDEETEHLGCTYEGVVNNKFFKNVVGVFKINYKSFK